MRDQHSAEQDFPKCPECGWNGLTPYHVAAHLEHGCSARSLDQIVYDMDNLRHMLGVRHGTRKRDYGYRNYFNSTEAGADFESMLRLESQGLVIRGRRCYWHATEAGCRAIGLDARQIKRALNRE